MHDKGVLTTFSLFSSCPIQFVVSRNGETNIALWAIWRLAQEVIRAAGKPVVFGGGGKYPKMTLDTYDLLLRACAVPVVGDAIRDGC